MHTTRTYTYTQIVETVTQGHVTQVRPTSQSKLCYRSLIVDLWFMPVPAAWVYITSWIEVKYIIIWEVCQYNAIHSPTSYISTIKYNSFLSTIFMVNYMVTPYPLNPINYMIFIAHEIIWIYPITMLALGITSYCPTTFYAQKSVFLLAKYAVV